MSDFDKRFPGQFFDVGGAVLNVLHPEYGAVWDVTDSYVTNGDEIFNAALEDLRANHGGRGIVTAPPGVEIHFPAPHDIPYTLGSGSEIRYQLTGVKLVASAGAPSVFRRVPTSTATGAAAAVAAIGCKIFITGGVWKGDGATVGQTAIDVSATYGGVISECDFTSFDNGVRLTFCLGVEVRNCLATLCRSRHFYARSGVGVWGDATHANSGCNKTLFRKCRVYGSAGALSHYEVYGSSGCIVDDCISEGFNPVNAIYFNSDLDPTARRFVVRDLHLECAPTNAAILVRAVGQVKVEGIFHQLPNLVLVDSTGSGSTARIFVREIEYSPGGDKFRHGAGTWRFEELPQTLDPMKTTFWTGGVVPLGTSLSGVLPSGAAYRREAADFFNLHGVFRPEKVNAGFNGNLVGIGGQAGADTLDAGTMAPGAVVVKTTGIFGAQIGDIVAVGFSKALPDGVHGWAQVTANGAPATVKIYLKNDSGVSQVVGFVSANLALFRAG